MKNSVFFSLQRVYLEKCLFNENMFLDDKDKTSENKVKDVIHKAKVEDDEYKTTSEEHTYYR